MSTDRELLELAAKAAGIPYIKPDPEYSGIYGLQAGSDNPMRCQTWNTLADNGDALRLATKLDINLEFDGQLLVRAFIPQKHYPDDALFRCTERYENHNGDKYAATRRAITRAAAEIGKAMP